MESIANQHGSADSVGNWIEQRNSGPRVEVSTEGMLESSAP